MSDMLKTSSVANMDFLSHLLHHTSLTSIPLRQLSNLLQPSWTSEKTLSSKSKIAANTEAHAFTRGSRGFAVICAWSCSFACVPADSRNLRRRIYTYNEVPADNDCSTVHSFVDFVDPASVLRAYHLRLDGVCIRGMNHQRTALYREIALDALVVHVQDRRAVKDIHVRETLADLCGEMYVFFSTRKHAYTKLIVYTHI